MEQAEWMRIVPRDQAHKWNRFKPDDLIPGKIVVSLSNPVLHTHPERLISTFAHEFCHITTMLLSKQHEYAKCHSGAFVQWGRKVTHAFPEIEVGTYHYYKIFTRYNYQCMSCNRVLKRHAKLPGPARARCRTCGNGWLNRLATEKPGQYAVEAPRMSNDMILEKYRMPDDLGVLKDLDVPTFNTMANFYQYYKKRNGRRNNGRETRLPLIRLY